MRIVRAWGRYRPLMFVVTVISSLIVGAVVEAVFGREKAAPEATPAAAPAAAAAEAPAAPAANLPDYYDGHATDTNGDGKVDDKDTPKWPDSTGGAAGVWTTAAAAPGGDDDPAKIPATGLYDRIAHNLYSINIVWTLITGFLVMFMQAGFALCRNGPVPCEELLRTRWP